MFDMIAMQSVHKKWPEELRQIEEFPRTPSGKIKKFELRARVRHEAAPDGATEG
jgi:acyl-coenzyme A synthetase/AMP-(fatty) acid ligase